MYLQQKGIDLDGRIGTNSWPRRQLEYYAYLLRLSSHYGDLSTSDRPIGSNEDNPLSLASSSSGFEIAWVDTFLVIHKFQSSHSREIRCSWYEEQIFWSQPRKVATNHYKNRHQNGKSSKKPTNNIVTPNRNLEDLSLAFVLGKWRSIQQRLVYDDSTMTTTGTNSWGEQILENHNQIKPFSISSSTSNEKNDESALSSRLSNSTTTNPGGEVLGPSQYYIRIHQPMQVRKLYDV